MTNKHTNRSGAASGRPSLLRSGWQKIRKQLTMGALLLLGANVSNAQLLNGNFEDNPPFYISPSWYQFTSYNTSGLSYGPPGYTATSIANWNIAANTIDLHNGVHGGMGTPTGGLNHHIDLNRNGRINQQVLLAAGATYNLAFWSSVHANSGSGATASADVYILDPSAAIIASMTINVTPADLFTWSPQALPFSTTASGLYTIEFRGTTSSYVSGGVLIDNASLTMDPPSCDDICYWGLTGNNIYAPGRNVFGTLTNDDVQLYTNNTPVGIMARNGYFGWSTTAPTARFHVDATGASATDGVRLQGLQLAQDAYVLTVDPNGNVHTRGYYAGPGGGVGSVNNCYSPLFLPRTITATGDMDCSQLYDDGTSVGINTTGPFSFVGSSLYSLDPAGSAVSGTLTLDVNGAVRGTQVYATSDNKFKTNVKPLESSLEKVLQMRAVEYNWKKEEFPERRFDDLKHIGFIAQELSKVLPDAVVVDKKGEYAVDYLSVIPVLTKAIQEQQKQIEELQKMVQSSNTHSINSDVPSGEAQNKDGYMEQNVPNPFSSTTTIKYQLPAHTQTAAIGIYDMNGQEIKLIPLSLEKEGSILIRGGELKAGMYLYTMIINGRSFESKKMILTSQ